MMSTLFKDSNKFTQGCNISQGVGNISRMNGMPLNKIMEIEIFDV